jgi:hypothetical protein
MPNLIKMVVGTKDGMHTQKAADIYKTLDHPTGIPVWKVIAISSL